MEEKYIELRQNRSFGDIITIYFDFYKQNLKSFTNIFLSYNGIFILLFLGCSYLMITGVMGMVSQPSGIFPNNEEENAMYLGAGAILFFLIFLIVSILNYSLSASYIITYEKEKQVVTDRKNVWSLISPNLGNIVVFILLMFLIYIGFMIVSVILAFIPLIGTLVQYVIQFALTSWLGISFMIMLSEKKSPIDSLSNGWELISSNFWICVGVNFILGFLIGILILLLISIPGFILGIYSYFSLEAGVVLEQSGLAKVLYTVGMCILLTVFTYYQALSQLINGVLYFSLHEKKYNIKTRAKIEQIGKSE